MVLTVKGKTTHFVNHTVLRRSEPTKVVNGTFIGITTLFVRSSQIVASVDPWPARTHLAKLLSAAISVSVASITLI